MGCPPAASAAAKKEGDSGTSGWASWKVRVHQPATGRKGHDRFWHEADMATVVTAGTPAAKALKSATRTIPIVMAVIGDPVAAGVVDSLAHPGGNATGFTILATELSGKRLQLLKEARAVSRSLEWPSQKKLRGLAGASS